MVNNAPPPPAPPEVDGASAMGALNGEEGCGCWACPNGAPLPNPPAGRVRLAPPAGEFGCEPKEKGAVLDGVVAPKPNEEGWLNVDGLLGADPDPL